MAFRLPSWLHDFLAEPIEEANTLQREWVAEPARPDLEPLIVLMAAAFGLTIRHYCFQSLDLFDFWAETLPGAQGLSAWAHAEENRQFARLLAWTIGQTVAFLVIPLVLNLLLLRRPLSEYGCRLKGAFRGGWIYAVMYLGILPAVIVLAPTSSFQHTYPFYKLAATEPFWPRFICWELLYAWQFIALEFFFRGFMVHGLKRRFGFYAVLVMTVPYCMIHFGKPLPETLGSIGAGVILGFMSLKTRSIWMGAALHIAVAWTMDVAALAARN